MADNSNDQPDIYFQTAIISFIHPDTGDLVTRSFIGKAFFDPDTLEQFDRQGKQVQIKSLEFDQPYNPFEDEENTEVHRKLTDHVREAVKKDQG